MTRRKVRKKVKEPLLYLLWWWLILTKETFSSTLSLNTFRKLLSFIESNICAELILSGYLAAFFESIMGSSVRWIWKFPEAYFVPSRRNYDTQSSRKYADKADQRKWHFSPRQRNNQKKNTSIPRQGTSKTSGPDRCFVLSFTMKYLKKRNFLGWIYCLKVAVRSELDRLWDQVRPKNWSAPQVQLFVYHTNV